MAAITHDQITDWKIIPIDYITLHLGTSGAPTTVKFGWLQDGSTWDLKPVTKPDDEGMERLLFYEFKGTFISMLCNFGDMKQAFNLINTLPHWEFTMKLKAPDGQPSGEDMDFNTVETGATVFDIKKWRFLIKEFNQSKESPKMTIEVSGILGKDIFSETIDIFNQNWS